MLCVGGQENGRVHQFRGAWLRSGGWRERDGTIRAGHDYFFMRLESGEIIAVVDHNTVVAW